MSGAINVTWGGWSLVPTVSPLIELSNQSRIGDIFVYVGATEPDANTSGWQLWTSDELIHLVSGIPAGHRVWLKTGSKVNITVGWRRVSEAAIYNLPDEGAYELVGNVAKRFVDDFGGTSLDTTKWDVETNTGGMNYSVSSSDLVVTMGTTANAELRLLSKAAFTIPVDVFVTGMLSQRLIDNGVYFELVEVDPVTLLPIDNPNIAGDWNNRVSIRLQGSTSSGNAAVEAVSQGSTVVNFVSTTSASTTTSNTDFNLRVREADVWFGSVPTDSNGARSSGEIRMSRQVPDPDKIYKFRMRFKNGATAPGSSTTVTVRSIRLLDLQEIQVDYASSGSSAGGNSLPISGSIGMIPYHSSSWGSGTTSHKLISAATTNATSVKSQSGKIVGGIAINSGAATRYLKFYNKASAPTVGTDTPVLTVPLPSNVPIAIADLVSISGYTLSTGVAYAITGGAADNDTTAVAAGEVIINLIYA